MQNNYPQRAAPAHGVRAKANRMVNTPRLLRAVALLIALLLLLPSIYLVIRAMGVGVEAFEILFHLRTAQILWNSVLLALLVTTLSLFISLPLAWLTTQTDLPFRRTWSVLSTLPLVFPSFVGSFALIAMMGPRGMLADWLAPFGVERIPSIYGLTGATWALTSFTYPYLLLSIRSSFRNLDPALQDAARNLGYGPWRTFFRITLPALRPGIVAGSLLVSLYVLSDFGAVSMLRYNTFTRAIYIHSSNFDRSRAAVLALVLALLALLLLFGAQRMQGRGRYYRSSAGAIRARKTIALKEWKWAAMLLCGTIVFVSLVLPTSVVIYWLLRGLSSGESLMPVWAAAGNSIHAAGLAAITCAVLAMPIAYMIVRYPSKQSTFVENATYIGYGLPGIVIALSLVYFGAKYLGRNSFFPLYQTLTMLICAYAVRFLPQAVGAMRTSLEQISPRLSDAAQSLGHGRFRTFGRVTLPLLRSGIWTGGALVFLTTIKELPATLILGPTGFPTLATQIWSATEEAFFARAAAPSLLLLLVSGLSMVILLRQEEKSESKR